MCAGELYQQLLYQASGFGFMSAELIRMDISMKFMIKFDTVIDVKKVSKINAQFDDINSIKLRIGREPSFSSSSSLAAGNIR